MPNVIKFTLFVSAPTDEDKYAGDEVEHDLPALWAICDDCQGNGKCDHPAFSNGITSSEWENEWDDDERDHYLSGRYDVACQPCKGTGKVLVIDEEHCDPALLKAWQDQEREMMYDRITADSERRMGA
jgi:hypothetical protein